MRRPVVLVVLIGLLASCTRGLERSAEVLRGSPSPVGVSPSATSQPTGTIRIRAPHEGDDVLSPVLVRGVATTASGEVLVRVVDAQGVELAAMNVAVGCGADCRGRFQARLAFYVPAREPGAVEAVEVGPGGVAAQLARVRVTLVPGP